MAIRVQDTHCKCSQGQKRSQAPLGGVTEATGKAQGPAATLPGAPSGDGLANHKKLSRQKSQIQHYFSNQQHKNESIR